MALPHLAVQLRLRREGGDGVDDNDVDSVGFDQHFADFQRLFPRVRLADEKAVQIDPEFLRIGGVERVLRVDEGGDAAGFLRVRDAVEGEGCLAGGFRPVEFDDAPLRHAADADGRVKRDGAGGDDVAFDDIVGAEAHDGFGAEALADIGEGGGEFLFLGRSFVRFLCRFLRFFRLAGHDALLIVWVSALRYFFTTGAHTIKLPSFK